MKNIYGMHISWYSNASMIYIFKLPWPEGTSNSDNGCLVARSAHISHCEQLLSTT
jgi:hypothetical protein